MKLGKLDRAEALRYLGYGKNMPDEKTSAVMDECERILLSELEPNYVFRFFPIEECPVKLVGNDINEHLKGCGSVVLLAATLGIKADAVIRKAEIEDMVKAVIFDVLASVATEQVCGYAENEIRALFPGKYMTWRFSAGYGDFPIELQKDFISALNAGKRIGLTVNSQSMMIPSKSVTAIIGLSDNMPEKKHRGCESCNLRDRCAFRAEGGHCGS